MKVQTLPVLTRSLTSEHVKSAQGTALDAEILLQEGTGTTISDRAGNIPDFTVLGVTTNIWDTANRFTYHSSGNGHARIVGDTETDNLFRQDDIDGFGGWLFFTGINYPSAPASNQRLFHYGDNGGAGQTGGVNCRLDSSAGNSTFSFAHHNPNNSGADLSHTTATVTAATDHTLAFYLDWTVQGTVTCTSFIDGVEDSSTTATGAAAEISTAGTLQGLEIAGRAAQPPDNLFLSGQMWGMHFIKFYYKPDYRQVIQALHNNYLLDLV